MNDNSKIIMDKLLKVLEPYMTEEALAQNIVACLKALVMVSATYGATSAMVAATDTKGRLQKAEQFAELFRGDLERATKSLLKDTNHTNESFNKDDDIVWQ
jgi:predicted DNA repair protein MutK